MLNDTLNDSYKDHYKRKVTSSFVGLSFLALLTIVAIFILSSKLGENLYKSPTARIVGSKITLLSEETIRGNRRLQIKYHPTVQPTMAYTGLETINPTPSTWVESQNPTPGPILHYTFYPTSVDDDAGLLLITPTPEPSVQPTVSPITAEPTPEPSVQPTVSPTFSTTAEPTNEPTSEPSDDPTNEPTIEPTDEPTNIPTIAPRPTVRPTYSTALDKGDIVGIIGALVVVVLLAYGIYAAIEHSVVSKPPVEGIQDSKSRLRTTSQSIVTPQANGTYAAESSPLLRNDS